MANQHDINRALEGKDTWNAWVEAIPDSGVDFGNVQLGEIDFSGFIFPSNTTFVETQFLEPVNFVGSRFEGDARLNTAGFHGNADFTNTEIEGDAIFEGVSFKASARFRDATFHQHAHFNNLRIENDAVLDSVRFLGPALFRDLKVSSKTTFARTQFADSADFSMAQFAELADVGGKDDCLAHQLDKGALYQYSSKDRVISFV